MVAQPTPPAPIALTPPRDAGQGALFPIEATVGPFALHLFITWHRVPRRRCEGCGKRRVCHYIGISDLVTSPKLCNACIRSST